MKTLLLVTKEKITQSWYSKGLQEVFHGYLNIESCLYINDHSEFTADSGITYADIVLTTNPYSFPHARRMMKPGAQLINMRFTFDKKYIEPLKAYPVGTEALICYPYYSHAFQMANILYESGLTNLNLYISHRDNLNLIGKKMELAIVLGANADIPEGIEDIIYLRQPLLSLTTLLNIAISADILNSEVEQRIARYCENTLTPFNNLSHFYKESAISSLQLKTVTACIDYAILIYKADGQIEHVNDNFINTFSFNYDLSQKKLFDVNWPAEFLEILRSENECENVLCRFKNPTRNMVVTKKLLDERFFNKDSRMILMKDATDYSTVENTIRKEVARRGYRTKYTFDSIVCRDSTMAECVSKSKRIAKIDKPTLIIGESGTGKELFAQSIHNASSRASYPFVPINCAAIPSELLESELFGYAEGAFTGAKKGGKPGLFQVANKGTLFLDEIGELPLTTQAKLLRVLEEREIMKVGSGELIPVDVRIIAATNRNLRQMVDENKFRLDLYYRLNTLIVQIPPLRKRPDDILMIVDSILQKEGKSHLNLAPDVTDFLRTYQWSGNVRELRNCIEYAASVAEGDIQLSDLPDYVFEKTAASESILYPTSTVPRVQTDQAADGQKAMLNAILSQLAQEPMGRYALLPHLIRKGFHVTEYKLRNVLNELAEQGYIEASRGRKGCTLTEKGRDYLTRL